LISRRTKTQGKYCRKKRRETETKIRRTKEKKKEEDKSRNRPEEPLITSYKERKRSRPIYLTKGKKYTCYKTYCQKKPGKL